MPAAGEQRTKLSEVFLSLNLDKSVRILDVACGIGVVAEELIPHGYQNIDGLDPIQGYLHTAQLKRLYRTVFKEFIDVGTETSIEDGSYDVVICCAGFFQGLISPAALPELIRICKPGGIVIWNIAEGFEDYSNDFKNHDNIVNELISAGRWRFLKPIEKFESLVFTDSGAALLKGYESGGLASAGFVYVMQTT